MTTIAQYTPEEIYAWLEQQVQARNLQARLETDRIHLEHGLLELAVQVEGDMDICEMAGTFQDIEDAWNTQEPRPSPQLLLMPRTIRQWQKQGVWHDVRDALQKQKLAIEIYDLAEDKEAIAAEFWAAREDFEASLKELELVMPRNGHAA